MGKITIKELQATYAELEKIHKEQASLAEREAYIKSILLTSIPPGGVKAGIMHTVRIGSSVSWGKAAHQIIDDLVPKTKRTEAAQIVASFTKETTAHLFKLASNGG